jgi:hypothetical protein
VNHLYQCQANHKKQQYEILRLKLRRSELRGSHAKKKKKACSKQSRDQDSSELPHIDTSVLLFATLFCFISYNPSPPFKVLFKVSFSEMKPDPQPMRYLLLTLVKKIFSFKDSTQ